MAVDFMVHRACIPKQSFGEGDVLLGTERMLDMLKALNRANYAADEARKFGKDPATFKFTILARGSDGEQSHEVSVGELYEEAAPLKQCLPHCQGCVANFQERSFAGCVGAINYPIAQASEAWLVDQVQPIGTAGAKFLLRAIADFGYTGEPIAKLRGRQNLYEASKSVEKVLQRKLLGNIRVSSDQLLQAILAVGNPLAQAHCLMVLLWLGAVKFDGRIIGSLDELPRFQVLRALPPAERQKRTSFAFVSGSFPPEAAQFVSLLDAMHRSWQEDVPLLVSA